MKTALAIIDIILILALHICGIVFSLPALIAAYMLEIATFLLIIIYMIVKKQHFLRSIFCLILCALLIIPSSIMFLNFNKKNVEFVIHATGSDPSGGG